MLDEIRIASLGVIDAATLELGPGLTAVTGETGAGKTMVVTALGLLLGQRGDSGAVRAGARRARVEGLVQVGATPGFSAAADQLGGEVEDDRVLVAREVAAEGRSRAFVGGAAVPVRALGGLIEPLVAVHGQSDQHRLLRPATQREALDSFGGAPVGAARSEYDEVYRDLLGTERELDDLVAAARERAREADLLAFGLAEVERVAPQVGEDVALAAEETRLAFADTLRQAAEEAREALTSRHDRPDALSAAGVARNHLESVRAHDPRAAELADRLAEVGYLLGDLGTDLAGYAEGLETDPVRLAAVSERRSALAGLTRRYGETVDDVLVWAAEAAERLADLQGTDDRVEALRSRAQMLRRRLGAAAAALSALRTENAARLATAVTSELVALAMPHARLDVIVRQQDLGDTEDRDTGNPDTGKGGLEVGARRLRFGPTGVDEVELLLAPHAGAEPRPLSRGASGGELSRVMLALEVALADTLAARTFVFDEVDAGVGGKAAVEVGRRLARLARTAQVLVVTHLPQVAAYADRHVVVVKSDDGSVTSAGLTTLDDAGRQRELSRMLAGLEDSETALAHARELLDTARASREATTIVR